MFSRLYILNCITYNSYYKCTPYLIDNIECPLNRYEVTMQYVMIHNTSVGAVLTTAGGYNRDHKQDAGVDRSREFS